MVLISFDIGIKNLAYCVLSDNSNIMDWKILNISCDELCEYISSKGTKCNSSGKYNINDLCICNSHSKLKLYLNEKKKKIKTKDTIFNIGKKMISLLDQEFENLLYDLVLIENQPSLKNPHMKSIQMVLYSYFLINSNARIEMVNASNKLKVYKGPPILCPYEKNKKNKYKINKFLSIQYTNCMIKNEDNKYIELFNSSNKKDDLADSYLQGIYWINK